MLALSTEKAESPKGLLSNILGLKVGSKGLSTDKFSALLKTFSLGKSDSKDFLFAHKADGLKLGIVEKGILKNTPVLTKVDPLLTLEPADTPKTSKLVSLLQLGAEKATDEEQLNPEIIKALPTKDIEHSIKTLISEAKSYLKEQITKETGIKKLPKTLGGLIRLAQKSGIEVKNITLDILPKKNLSPVLTKLIEDIKPKEKVLNLSTSELVKATPLQKEPEQKPLNLLLTDKVKEVLSIKVKEKSTNTPVPILAELEELVPETPKASKAILSSVQALLHGEGIQESTEGEVSVKTDLIKEPDRPIPITQAKNEALTQKITDAKQLIEHVSQNIKESVENYKPPFTRIKMMLNPQKFGDMEVTLIQRGNNVHININASSSALTVMMQNSHELRAQLSAAGLGDASMNFSSHQQEQQQQRQKQEHAGLSYEEYQEYEDEFTEVATALEIVLPKYI